MREPLQGQLPTPKILLPRSIPVDGLRATDLSREPSRYTNLFAGPSAQALSCRHPRQSLSLRYLGRRQREQRLAYLCRLCAGVDPHRPNAVMPKRISVFSFSRPSEEPSTPGRSISVFRSSLASSVSQTQGRDQTPHFDGLTRQHSLFYPHYRGQNTRRQVILDKLTLEPTSCLHHRPRLCRFPVVCIPSPKAWRSS